jgi:aspartate 1-decarboxylase
MDRKMLKSKIHRATVTGADLHYEGSITIDRELMEAADIIPYEAVCIWDVNSGSRLETYAIAGEPGSGVICLNGAAARMVAPQDLVIIASFVSMSNAEALVHEPKLVFVDDKNRMLDTRKEVAGQAVLKSVHWQG